MDFQLDYYPKRPVPTKQYNPQNIPGVADNVQWKDSYSTNLRVSKRLRWKQGYMDLIVDVQKSF